MASCSVVKPQCHVTVVLENGMVMLTRNKINRQSWQKLKILANNLMQNASIFKSDFSLHTHKFEVRRNTASCPHSVLYSVIICKEHNLWQNPGSEISKTRFRSRCWDELNGQIDNSSV